jgi:DNA-binding IclR family transcriptional regulator
LLVQLGYLDYDRERRRFYPTMRIGALGGPI